MTHDNSYHPVLAEKIVCPHIPYSKSLNKLCINKNYSSIPWSLDMALIAFKSRIDYEVVSKYASIKRNGFHVYVSGYPDISEDEVKYLRAMVLPICSLNIVLQRAKDMDFVISFHLGLE